MRTLLTATAICLLLAACQTTSTLPQPSKPEPAKPLPAAPTPPAAKAAPVIPVQTEAQRLEKLRAALANKSVYFDYDNFSLKPQYQDVVKQNADFMKQAGKDTVVLEGNADERGSKEYNLALGQKRAEAVRKAMIMVGVPDARIEAISYGKEKPRATCQEEKCWQENRRVDFAHMSN